MNYANNLVNPAFSVLYHANGASEATAYDNFGRLQAVRRGALSVSGSNGSTLDTVTTVTDPTHGSSPIYGSQEWTLDQLGNWTGVESDTSTDTRTHNAQNELTADSEGALGYDNNGNLTTQAGYATNTYDAWNRATTIRGVRYAYDALGRRIWESANGGRAFFYDGQQMIETRTGLINTLSPSAQEQYVYGQGYIDDVILRDAEVNGGGNLGINGSGLDQRIYYEQDRENDVVAITDQSGTVVERYVYDPYGSQSVLDANWDLLPNGSAYGNEVGFTGRWLDSTQMLYFRARYLDPVLGRFTQRDRFIQLSSLNYYSLAGCDPANFVDPSGLSFEDCNKNATLRYRAALANANGEFRQSMDLLNDAATDMGKYQDWKSVLKWDAALATFGAAGYATAAEGLAGVSSGASEAYKDMAIEAAGANETEGMASALESLRLANTVDTYAQNAWQLAAGSAIGAVGAMAQGKEPGEALADNAFSVFMNGMKDKLGDARDAANQLNDIFKEYKERGEPKYYDPSNIQNLGNLYRQRLKNALDKYAKDLLDCLKNSCP